MRTKDEIRDFLTSRRANVTLAQVGLPISATSVASPACVARRSRSSRA